MLGDFTVKKHKIRKGNLYLTKNRFERNEIWFAEDDHSFMCHICAKGFLNSNFNEAVIDKISVLTKLPQNFTFSQKSQFSSIIGTF